MTVVQLACVEREDHEPPILGIVSGQGERVARRCGHQSAPTGKVSCSARVLSESSAMPVRPLVPAGPPRYLSEEGISRTRADHAK